jgi:hypothetical protein
MLVFFFNLALCHEDVTRDQSGWNICYLSSPLQADFIYSGKATWRKASSSCRLCSPDKQGNMIMLFLYTVEYILRLLILFVFSFFTHHLDVFLVKNNFKSFYQQVFSYSLGLGFV